jgi:hypothetical protein
LLTLSCQTEGRAWGERKGKGGGWKSSMNPMRRTCEGGRRTKGRGRHASRSARQGGRKQALTLLLALAFSWDFTAPFYPPSLLASRHGGIDARPPSSSLSETIDPPPPRLSLPRAILLPISFS